MYLRQQCRTDDTMGGSAHAPALPFANHECLPRNSSLSLAPHAREDQYCKLGKSRDERGTCTRSHVPAEVPIL